MSSTNKTSHYNLPQFIGSDIPTWLGDFNSAMTAIDSGINAAATTASGAATDAAQALTNAAAAQKSANDALNRCPFPIGFGGFFRTDPTMIYSGTTWEQKKDVFILAAGDTYPAGSTGGEAQHKLTQEEIPNYKIGDIPEAVPAEHNNWNNGGVHATDLGQTSVSKPGVFDFDNKLKITAGYQYGYSVSTYGGDQPHNNMPPYFAMPFWVRTA